MSGFCLNYLNFHLLTIQLQIQPSSRQHHIILKNKRKIYILHSKLLELSSKQYQLGNITRENMAGMKDSASRIVEMSPIPKSIAIIPSEATYCKKYQSLDSGIRKSGQQFYIDLSRPSVGVTLSPNICNFDSRLNSTTHIKPCMLSEFEYIEAACNDSTVNIMEITHIPKKGTSNNEHKSSQEILKHIPVQNSYVKLSDLDNPVSQSEVKYDDTQKTGSISEKSLVLDQPTSDSVTLHSLFYSDNALSLNRLFPNLKNYLSKSMAGSLSGRSPSPLRPQVFPSPVTTDNTNLMSIDSELSSRSIRKLFSFCLFHIDFFFVIDFYFISFFLLVVKVTLLCTKII